jgi:nicotinate-nucleotide adenylyltransferase
MRKIGLFGGAFDPVHDGHLHIAQRALECVGLDRVIFIPLYQAAHKQPPSLSPEKRLSLLKKATADQPKFTISTMEIERKGTSYAIDTLREFKIKHPEYTGADLYYIIGSDAFEQIFTWKEPDALLSALTFIVVSRPGYDFMTIEHIFALPGRQQYLDHVLFVEDQGLDISSTKIRESWHANANGQS